jgi:hypothetical protein
MSTWIVILIGCFAGIFVALGVLFWRVYQLEERIRHLNMPVFRQSSSLMEVPQLVESICELQDSMTDFANQVENYVKTLELEIKEAINEQQSNKVVLEKGPDLQTELVESKNEESLEVEEKVVSENGINTRVEQILKLAETGMRTAEIARQLQLGIGEVQLMLQVARRNQTN